MKLMNFFGTLMLVFLLSSAFTMKKSNKWVYMAGVSASFSDSLVYFTDVQQVDSVTLDANKLLPDRSQYSYQLKTYLESKYATSNRTCFIYFNESKAKLEKEIKKLKAKYQKGGKSIIRQETDFKFKKAETY